MANIFFNNILILNIISLFIIAFKVQASPFEYATLSNGYKYIKHTHSEASYQHAWCSNHQGTEEYENKDFTRVDCLTTTHAVEFDFSNKWAECVGQALYYGLMTGKKPMCVLILDGAKWKKQKIYYNRVKKLGAKHNMDSDFVTDELINLDITGHCIYEDCKCNK